MVSEIPFITLVPSFDSGNDAILLLANSQTIAWLMHEFARISNAPPECEKISFVLGDGHPVESDGRCIVTIELGNQSDEASELQAVGEDAFTWRMSRSSADHYHSLLSGMLSGSAGHQYLEPHNSPPAPVLVVSLGEYPLETFRPLKKH